HIIPLYHAHRHGGDSWSESLRTKFANDYENLLVVDDATNQSKSDRAPHEWLPPQENYWCEYGKRWEWVKDKYGLRYTHEELMTLSRLADTCI
ncbi:MAG: HNH endonuclease, partial [Betaproteobacteria bacterium]|nr:HNH endonuclease [Betaproteobacteria bacterium]